MKQNLAYYPPRQTKNHMIYVVFCLSRMVDSKVPCEAGVLTILQSSKRALHLQSFFRLGRRRRAKLCLLSSKAYGLNPTGRWGFPLLETSGGELSFAYYGQQTLFGEHIIS